jgi:hypothetical protein
MGNNTTQEYLVELIVCIVFFFCTLAIFNALGFAKEFSVLFGFMFCIVWKLINFSISITTIQMQLTKLLRNTSR